MVDVSVVIVNWNTKNLLIDCLEYLILSTIECKIEIILVDNASEDGSVAAVRQKYPNVRIIVNEKNEGFAKANNIGMRASNSKYICLSNTDIKVLGNALDKMFSYMENYEKAGVLLPKCVDGKMKLRPCCREFPTLRNMFCEAFYLDKIFNGIKFLRGRSIPLNKYQETCSVDTVPFCFTIVRKEAIEEVGMLDESFFFYGEDVDWCKRFKVNKWDVVYYPKSKVIHYGGASSDAIPEMFLIERVKSTLNYWTKHHNITSNMLCKMIMILHYSNRVVGNGIIHILNKKKSKEKYHKLRNDILVLRWLIFKRVGF